MSSELYVSYTLSSNDEILLALLSVLPFASFEELEEGMIAYIAQSELTEDTKNEIHRICTERDVTYNAKLIPYQNWNAQWEASFQPVEINSFCRVRADFHERIDGYTHDIIINPKMAFGTGHHETTWMMIDAMSRMDMSDKIVFDYGAGTGVLAIVAEKMGATSIDALDIEIESYENTIENAKINKCSKIKSLHGTVSIIKNAKYDIILANINRYVLLTTVTKLKQLFESDGILLLSGILAQDIDLVTECYKKAGFSVQNIAERGNWRCIQLGV